MVNSPVTESRIRRAAQAVSFGLSVEEIAEIFVEEGTSPETAFLAAVAGRVFADTIEETVRDEDAT